MRGALLATLLGTVVAVPGGGARAEVDRETMIRLASSVVKIEAATPSGYALGSGIIVGADQVATNCHVTRRALGVYVLHGGLRRAASEQSSDMGHDLCLLRVDGLEGRAAEIAPSSAGSDGDPLLAIGYSGGLDLRFSEGQLVSKVDLPEGRLLRSDTVFASGASGGGLFDRHGRLLGILTFRLRGGDQHYYSIPASWIAEKIGTGAPYAPIGPITGQAFWEQPRFQLRGTLDGAGPETPPASAAVPTGSALETESAPISRAEQLVFLDPHLANIKPPQTLRYRVVDEDGAKGRSTETASIALKAGPDGRCCLAQGKFPSSAGDLTLPEVADANANPIVLYFLEHEVRMLQGRHKGKSAYFQKRIRMALADAANVSETTVRWQGKDVPAQRVTIQPFRDDPNHARFERDVPTEYRFLVSSSVPGGIAAISASLADAKPSVRRSLVLEGVAETTQVTQ